MNAILKPIRATSKTPINLTWECITPTKAKQLLKQTNESNFEQRKISTGIVKKYINEMVSGNWHNGTADVVRLGSDDGKEIIIDGQHRLAAIANTTIGQNVFVARNVPTDAFKYIDQGNVRTLKDVMDCAGWESTPTLSAAGRYLWVYSIYGAPFKKVGSENSLSAGSLFDWVEGFVPSIVDEWEENKELVIGAKKGIKMAEGIMLFLWIKMAEKDKEAAAEVFTYLRNPLDRTIKEPSLSFQFAVKFINEMHQEMQGMKSKGMKTRSDEHRDPCTSALIYAWNCLREKKVHKTQRGFNSAMKKANHDFLWNIK